MKKSTNPDIHARGGEHDGVGGVGGVVGAVLSIFYVLINIHGVYENNANRNNSSNQYFCISAVGTLCSSLKSVDIYLICVHLIGSKRKWSYEGPFLVRSSWKKLKLILSDCIVCVLRAY